MIDSLFYIWAQNYLQVSSSVETPTESWVTRLLDVYAFMNELKVNLFILTHNTFANEADVIL
jgi:hypothetical protein